MNQAICFQEELEAAKKLEWVALYTKSRHEKFIHEELKRRNINSFLPVRHIKKRWSDRTVLVEEPLFKSYLFVKTNRLSSVDILRVKGAVKFVSVQGKPLAVDEKVIESLKSVLSQEIDIDPFPYLNTGDKVYVRSGIFKGVEGYVVRKDNKKCRLVISIDAIMSSISVEVDADLVEKL